MDEQKKAGEEPEAKGLFVRLRPAYRAAIEVLRAKSRRTLSAEVEVALERHFAAEGLAFDPDAPG